MSEPITSGTNLEQNQTASPSVVADVEAVDSPKHVHVEGEDVMNSSTTKQVEEEEEDEETSDSSGGSEAHEGEGREEMDEGVEEVDQIAIYEEMVPVTLNLKSGEWELRDQFVWPVTLPVELLAYDCNDYIMYNLRDPRIDVFALRTIEEMDFPIGFDISVSKSIRAQLMSIIPVLWKEKVSVIIQERRAALAQRCSTTLEPSNTETGGLDANTTEQLAQDIIEYNAYPINAVRRLLKGPTDEEAEKTKQTQNDEKADFDDEETDTLKKRKRALEDEASGRKKRKRGTAFEAHNLLDERIAIRLNIALAGVQLQDQFDWDPAMPLYWTDIFARRMSTELGLPREMETAISYDIKRQVLAYLGHSTHQIPSDWLGSQNSSQSSSTSQATLKSSGLVSNSSAPYFPTRSLPILSIHNVIRPPQYATSFEPSLTAHTPSQNRWDRSNARQRARYTRATPASPPPTSAHPPTMSNAPLPTTPNAPKPTQNTLAPRPSPIR